MAEYRHLANGHPHWIDFPNNLPPNTRHVTSLSRDRVPITPQDGLDIDEFDIPARDGYPIRVRFYKQSNLTDLPLLVYLHPGGFVTGGLETDDEPCRVLAAEVPVLILSVEYRLAPEHPFPTGFEDSFDVVRWAASHGPQRLPINLDRGFILGGTSAGANFTAGIAHLALQEGLSPSLTGLLFMAASFCHPDARPVKYLDRILSVDEIYDDAPGLTRKSIDHFAGQYGAHPEDKRLSPLLFESHANLAKKAIFYVCGWDPRRDEALLFEQLLREEKLDTKLYVYPGLPHGFWTTCPDLEVSKKWEQDLVEGVKFLLQ